LERPLSNILPTSTFANHPKYKPFVITLYLLQIVPELCPSPRRRAVVCEVQCRLAKRSQFGHCFVEIT